MSNHALFQNENKEIKLHLHYDNKEAIVNVMSLDPIKVIENKIPFPCKIIYNSAAVLPAFTFAFYGILDGSHLLIVPFPSEKEPSPIDMKPKECFPIFKNVDKAKYLKAFKRIHGNDFDEDEFERSFKIFIDPRLAKEATMIKDRFFRKVEGTIKCHRKYLKQFFQCKNKPKTSDTESSTPETNISHPLLSPSTTPINLHFFEPKTQQNQKHP